MLTHVAGGFASVFAPLQFSNDCVISSDIYPVMHCYLVFLQSYVLLAVPKKKHFL